ncbi:uncharacterized protein BT62DRAFT_985126 [Guyanagaster necrorhizus]|uniref:RING-type E3 ubiquitin transferase n=1 Tax=Guyanagaster necrorhizus TaxID=856835 RepID=A0A9P8AVG7_9AGAR|nr:uncharacterized protein BT62DRAFT_985126 [Guyanagaster necrorhizus MCA 3950]KAG7449523.1 hypothetical protein BT62DRAFT_985126 [Guyanagaster necrorhizus MCA 3950]
MTTPLTSDGTLRRIKSLGDLPKGSTEPSEDFLQNLKRSKHEHHDRSDGGVERDVEHDNSDNGVGPSTIRPLSKRSNSSSHISLSKQTELVQSAPSSPFRLSQERVEQPAQAVRPAATAPAIAETHGHQPERQPQSRYRRIMTFFGYGRGASRERRSNVSLGWNCCWGLAQIIVIIVILALSSHLESKTIPGVNQLEACTRPLGVWAGLWIGRVFVACILSYWSWQRERLAAAVQGDSEAANASQTQPPPSNSNAQASTNSPSANNDATDGETQPSPPLPYTGIYRKLTLFSTLFSFSWFLTAHILIYTSVESCRLSSPLIWWLIFGILCITYLMVVEVIILGLIVFLIAPILFLFWNIFLMCLGRHPLQNPGLIKPEIGKLSKSVVDRIPLVMYIPPPPDPSSFPIKVPEAIYTYPPSTPGSSNTTPTKRRFRFLKVTTSKQKTAGIPSNKSSISKSEGKKATKPNVPETWEDHWEQEGYPFVVLEGNRAACAICLMDFEEPKRIVDTSEKGEKSSAEATPDNAAEGQRDVELKPEDTGDGAQPLRLLACGHVFHPTCLDPWLTDVSGRCPVCQRAVELPGPSSKRTKRSDS